MSRVPTLLGTGGSFRGESYPLEQLRPYVVGRSRTADISLRLTQHYRLQTDEQRDADTRAKTVSARHFQITVFNAQTVEIKNLSVNGTLLDGKPIGDIAIVTDIETAAHTIGFGEDAQFELALRAAPGAPPVPQPGIAIVETQTVAEPKTLVAEPKTASTSLSLKSAPAPKKPPLLLSRGKRVVRRPIK